MQIKTYLQNYQPIIYRTFVNALENKKLSHAYLLSGSVGTPLKEAAIYLAKSILCDERDPLACDRCMTCVRIDEGNYADLIIAGADDGKIKKDDVEKILGTFDKTALEDKGIMIYILHKVETMTTKAVNSLLKFLEEPGRNVFAFLTTENEAKLLPTIVSRTQVLRFRDIDRNKIVKESVEFGIPQIDAEILSGFYNDPSIIKEVSESKEYLSAKNLIETYLASLCENPNQAVYVNQSKIIPQIKTDKNCRLFIKILGEVFKDLVSLSVNESITIKSYANILHDVLPHLKHIDKSLTVILGSERKLDLNVNEALLLDHITYKIVEEEK